MKIALLSFFSGHNERGVERWVYELATRLSNKHEVVVFQNKHLKTKTKYKISSTDLNFVNNKKEFLFPLQKKAFLDYKSRRILLFVLKIFPILWKKNFDVVIPTDGGWEPAFVRFLTWIRRKKMIIVGHAGIGWDDRNNLLCFPDVFVALSSYGKKWAKKVSPFVNVVRISDGVNLDKFKPEGNKTTLGLRKPVVLCVAALSKAKRVDLTIKAVSKLKGVSLLVAGTGELKKETLVLGKSLLGNRFKLASFKFKEMPGVYRSADVFTVVSEPHHSFEMVLLEAMATNLPVVANDDPIRREIVGDAGMFVDPDDIDAYAKVLDKSLSVDWGEKPRKQAEKYSWEKVIGRFENLFSKLTKQ